MILFIAVAAMACVLWITVGWLACRFHHQHQWAGDEQESRKAWAEVAEYHDEVITQRKEMMGIFEELTEVLVRDPEPTPVPGADPADSAVFWMDDQWRQICEFRAALDAWEASALARTQVWPPDA